MMPTNKVVLLKSGYLGLLTYVYISIPPEEMILCWDCVDNNLFVAAKSERIEKETKLTVEFFFQNIGQRFSPDEV